MIDFPMTALAIAAGFGFGICIGSFLNVLIWRLPREQSIRGRSICPQCQHRLTWYDLIPLFSWLVQNRQCRYCHKPISWRYPFIEGVTGILFAFAAWHIFSLTSPQDLASYLLLLKFFVVMAVCLTVFVIDLEHYLILDRIVFPSIILLLLLAIASDLAAGQLTLTLESTTISGSLAALLAFIPFWLVWYFSNKKWLGLGDAKFVIFMGLALGLPGIAVALFVAFMLGAGVGLILIVLRQKSWGSKLPFGTFLALATVLALFWGSQLWGWYWGLFGIMV